MTLIQCRKKTVAHHVSSVKRDFQKKSTSHTKRIILGYVQIMHNGMESFLKEQTIFYAKFDFLQEIHYCLS